MPKKAIKGIKKAKKEAQGATSVPKKPLISSKKTSKDKNAPVSEATKGKRTKKKIVTIKETIRDNIGKRIRKSRRKRDFGYIMSALVMIVLFSVFNSLLSWHIDWLDQTFVAPLFVFKISFLATILANLFYLFYDGKWLRSLFRIVLNMISFAAVYTLKIVFPFSVNDSVAHDINLVLVILLVCIVIGIFVDLIQFALNFFRFIIRGDNE